MNRYRGLALGASTALLGVVLGLFLLDLRDSWQAPSIVISDPLPGSEIGVTISGAVATPGTYFLSGNSRLTHLIDAAGGVTASADLAYLNMASRLHDEQQVVVPTRVPAAASGDKVPEGGAVPSAMGITSTGANRVNINTATKEELDDLPGIGPVLAELIVEEREQIGPYSSVDDLVRISGISQKMVDELRDLITV